MFFVSAHHLDSHRGIDTCESAGDESEGNLELEGETSGPDWSCRALEHSRFFMQRMLPDCNGLAAKVTAGADSTMAMQAEAF